MKGAKGRDEKEAWGNLEVMVSQVHAFVKTSQAAHFKYVQFIVYQLYLEGIKSIHEMSKAAGI